MFYPYDAQFVLAAEDVRVAVFDLVDEIVSLGVLLAVRVSEGDGVPVLVDEVDLVEAAK